MQSAVLIIHVLAAVAVIVLVLLQHGRGADAGAAFGSGSSGTVFGARGAASFLTRLTTMMATIFFLTSISLAWMASQTLDQRSVVERVEIVEPEPGPAPATTGEGAGDVPAFPSAPVSEPDATGEPEAPPPSG